MSVAEQGVYWPFKTLLQGSGIVLTEDPTSIRIVTTGAGPGGGDMLSSVFATNGNPGVVDTAMLARGLAPGATVPLAQQANAVPWAGITGAPTSFPSDWSVITSKPTAFPPSPHAPTHLPGGTDPIALAGPTAPGMLAQLSGNSTDYVGGDNATHALADAIGQVADPTIWLVRLRSYNAIGNPNMDVYQRRAGNALTITSGSAWLEDRWIFGTCAGVSLTGQRTNAGSPGGILLPGTSFPLSRAFLRLTLNGTKTALAATDWMGFEGIVEGPVFRELSQDNHSFSLLVRSSVPNLKICVAIRDGASPPTRSLVNVVQLGAANTLTVIPLPNLGWPSGGTFNLADGLIGYTFLITVATGSNYWGASGSEGTWQNGNFIGSNLQSNFAFGPVGSTFDLCFVQHEPGPVCSTFMDKSYSQNLFECERYFNKNFAIGNLPGAAPGGSWDAGKIASSNIAFAYTKWRRRMAKIPAVVLYNASTGAINQVYGQDGLPYQGIAQGIGDTGFYQVANPANNFPAAGVTGNWLIGYFYTADTSF